MSDQRGPAPLRATMLHLPVPSFAQALPLGLKPARAQQQEVPSS